MNINALKTREACPPGEARGWAVRKASRLALALIFFLGLAARCPAQTGTQHEYELKAGVLYHIIEYVEWPSGALSNNPPAIQIGLLGELPFADALEVLNGKTVQG